MHRDAPVDLGRGCGGVNGAVELARAERIDGVLTGEQPAAGEDPAFGVGVPPPGAQLLEQDRREHGVAVLGPFTLLDAQHHSLAVDVTDLERDDFARAQSGAVGEREGRLVLTEPAAGVSRAASARLITTGSLRSTRTVDMRAISS